VSKLTFINCDGHVRAEPQAYVGYLDQEFRADYEASLRGPQIGNCRLEPEVQWDSAARWRELETQGVAAEVLFPNGAPFGIGVEEVDTSSARRTRAGRQAYNRFLADFVAEDPKRRVGLAMIGFDDIDGALDDIQWAAGHGLRGLHLPIESKPPFYIDPALDPIWRTAAELDLTLGMHTGNIFNFGAAPASLIMTFVDAFYWCMHASVGMVAAGVFHRYPELRLSITETQIDWVPGVLDHLDWLPNIFEHGGFGDEFAGRSGRRANPVKDRPSDYFNEHVWHGASLMSHGEADRIRAVGIGHVMYGIDFPHYEGAYPHALDWMRATIGARGFGEDEIRALLAGNAAAAYGFDLDYLRPIAERVGFELSDVLSPPTEAGLLAMANKNLHRPSRWAPARAEAAVGLQRV
jgi:predicted TIM-barrel fold metal-dependent hydrolase